MTELCDQQEQSNLLLSSRVDKIFKEDKNADVHTTDSTNTASEETSKCEQSFIKNQRIQQFFFKMYLVFREIVVILFVAIAYAALTNDVPKQSKSPAAFPFFPKDSIVTDWYHGELSAAIIKARESDIAFVMFYAAWDAESQDMRKEFDLVAQYMHKEISFAAVNCWQPNSECRKQYTKAYSWPVLIAYPTHGKGIQYKGPQLASYMVKFLKSISRPFVRVYDVNEVNDLLTVYDAVVLGCVDATPGSYSYGIFYTTALKFLEKDPLQEVVFAVSTECISDSPKNTPTISLHMWNETLLYTSDEWKSNALLTWILTNLHQVSMWVSPTGAKSMSLSLYLQPGPTLILFTPRNPLDDFSGYYALLQEVALEYYNCASNSQVQLVLSLINKKRLEYYKKQPIRQKTCSEPTVQQFPSTVTFAMPKKWANNSCPKCEPLDLVNERVRLHCDDINQKSQETCEKREFKENVGLCHAKEDSKSAENLVKLWDKENCRIAAIAKTVQPQLSPPYWADFENLTRISGGACKTNSSLALIVLDSIRYYHFAQRLGVDVFLCNDKTAAVIINQKAETHYILNENVNDKTLRDFMNNFTTNNLPRAYASETTLASTGNPQRQRHGRSSDIQLLELNTDTFFPVVMQDNKAVMVFYYSKQCSFCSGISYIFLTVAKMLRSIQSLQFTRVDGDSNVLPWAFTMDRYPTIIFFPKKLKSESRVFPRDIPLSISNLVSFILVNLNHSLKLHVMWTLCNQTKFEEDREFCIASLRSENLSVISSTLRTWRNADLLTKSKLLYKLQQLRNLNLLLAHSPDNEKDIKRYLDRLHLVTPEDGRISSAESSGKEHVHDEF